MWWVARYFFSVLEVHIGVVFATHWKHKERDEVSRRTFPSPLPLARKSSVKGVKKTPNSFLQFSKALRPSFLRILKFLHPEKSPRELEVSGLLRTLGLWKFCAKVEWQQTQETWTLRSKWSDIYNLLMMTDSSFNSHLPKQYLPAMTSDSLSGSVAQIGLTPISLNCFTYMPTFRTLISILIKFLNN